MPYNISSKAVNRWSSYLDRLKSGDTLHLTTEDSHKLAYRLREALKSALVLGIEPYASLEGTYQFKPRPGLLICEPKQLLKAVHVEARITSHPGVRSQFDIVTLLSDTLDTAVEFPDYTGDTGLVESWAEKQGWIVTLGPPLVLKRGAKDVPS
jgi:hypothetical protein